MSCRLLSAPVALLVLLIVGCGDKVESKVDSVSGGDVVVTRDSGDLPEGCSAREAAEVVLTFTEGLNEKDAQAADSAFALGKTFSSVGVGNPGGRTGEDTNNRDSLRSYFESRISMNETYEVLEVSVRNDVGGSTSGGEMVRVDFLANRSADDLGAESLDYRGWGEIMCPEKLIYLLNLGRLHPNETTDDWCPDKADDADTRIVACAAE